MTMFPLTSRSIAVLVLLAYVVILAKLKNTETVPVYKMQKNMVATFVGFILFCSTMGCLAGYGVALLFGNLVKTSAELLFIFGTVTAFIPALLALVYRPLTRTIAERTTFTNAALLSTLLVTMMMSSSFARGEVLGATMIEAIFTSVVFSLMFILYRISFLADSVSWANKNPPSTVQELIRIAIIVTILAAMGIPKILGTIG